MNLTKIAVLFVIISIPFYFISSISIRQIEYRENIKNTYKEAVMGAIDDGIYAMRRFAKGSYDSENLIGIEIDEHEVMNSFLNSYYYSLNAISESDKIREGQYLFSVVLLGYDGYYIYSTRQMTNTLTGTVDFRPMLSEKRPYLYIEGDTTVQFTLNQHVKIIEKGTSKTRWNETQGILDDSDVLDKLPSSITASNYDSVRGYTIRSTIEKAIAASVGNHNNYTTTIGNTYVFHLPVGEDSGIGGAMDDLGIIVFFQGKAVGNGEYLEFNELTQSRLMVREEIIGYEAVDPLGGSSTLYYCTSECSHSHINKNDSSLINNIVKRFMTKEEAAEEGFWPCRYVGY